MELEEPRSHTMIGGNPSTSFIRITLNFVLLRVLRTREAGRMGSVTMNVMTLCCSFVWTLNGAWYLQATQVGFFQQGGEQMVDINYDKEVGYCGVYVVHL